MSDMTYAESLKVLIDAIDQVQCNGPARRVLEAALGKMRRLVDEDAARQRILSHDNTRLVMPAPATSAP